MGTWRLGATKISPGGIVREWTIVENGEIFELKSNRSFQKQNVEVLYGGNYTFEDGEKLFLNPDNDFGNVRYYADLKGPQLILGFIGYIEECSYRYKRID